MVNNKEDGSSGACDTTPVAVRSTFLSKSSLLLLQAILSVCLLLTSGCGPKGLEKVQVTGTVTVDGKAPPGTGMILFLPISPADGFPSRPASANFDTSGEYEATSFQPGDGLFPGRFQISVECWKSPPNMEGIPVVNYIHNKYQSIKSSGIEELVIESGSSSIVLDLDLESAP